MITYFKKNSVLLLGLILFGIGYASTYSTTATYLINKTAVEIVRIVFPLAGKGLDAATIAAQECKSQANYDICLAEKLGMNKSEEPNYNLVINKVVAAFGGLLLLWMLFPCRKIFLAVKTFAINLFNTKTGNKVK